MDARISVVINTLNEEANLPYALRSVAPWADEIVVVDMHSDDRTAEIARGFGAVVHLHERVGFADPARAFAISQATGEWVLILDADELIPAPLSRKCQEVARCDLADGINIPRLNYFFGSPLMHTCVGPEQDRQMRFFKRSTVRLNGSVHNFLQMIPSARILDLPYHPDHSIVHFAYADIAQFLDKQNRYSTIEAQQSFAHDGEAPIWVQRELQPYPSLLALFRRRRPTSWWALVYALLVLYSRYVKNGGYRDGWRGFYLTLFNVGYFLASYAKLAELEADGGREAGAERYRREAERILTGGEAIARDGTRKASPPPSCAK